MSGGISRPPEAAGVYDGAARVESAREMLHRVEAACIPTNLASVRLLEKSGFRREGYARSYLCINGTWQDHLLYARLQNDPKS